MNPLQYEKFKNLSPQQQAIIMKKIRETQQNQRTKNRLSPIVRADRNKPIPLSSPQKRLFFLEHLEKSNAVYHIILSIRISGRLDHSALEQGLQTVVNRHEILRTVFLLGESQPVQHIIPHLAITLETTDLSHFPKKEAEERARVCAAEKGRAIFDIEKGPLYQTRLYKLTDTEHILVLVLHHLIADGWSRGVLLKELSELYRAYAAASAPELPALSLQYADYAVWQEEYASGEQIEKDLAYWRRQLSGPLPILDLPADYPRPKKAGLAGAKQPFLIQAPLVKKIREVSERQGATLFMTLLAAFQTLLFRYTGQNDLMVGTPVAGRTDPELEPLIGCFINTLVIRTRPEKHMRFDTLLQQVKETTLQAYSHQGLPFEKLIDNLQIERDLSRSPLFQVMFVLQNAPIPKVELGDLTLHPFEVDNQTAKFDWTLELIEDGDQIQGHLEYNTELFAKDTIQRATTHYLRILSSIAEDDQQTLSSLDMLTEEEKRQILIEWNQTNVPYPLEKTLATWLEEQADRTPDHPAVLFGGRMMTYQELNRRANQLAAHLVRLGVEPDTLVGISVKRSLEMMIGVIGILKAGGAFVPIDPDYPQERIDYMLQDSAVEVLLTQSTVHLPETSLPREVLFLDTWLEQAGEDIADVSNPEPRSTAKHLAYVIYTSGTTGLPKGVMNTHRGIVNRLLWMQDEYPLTEDDRVLQKTPLSFDVSVWELFWPLMTGAALVIAKPDGHKDSRYLVDLINREGITTLHFVPSMLQAFLEEDGLAACTSLKRVICSGEALPLELQKRFQQRLTAQLYNLYGPTEAAIDVTAWDCQETRSRASVPIGRPIANTRLYILDAIMQPVPIGVAGELYIGGIGVARGYLHKPALTEERFLPDPFSSIPSDRLYKTGDLCRYGPDGVIEYLGRLDNQVKLRGFRIELEEIEAVLSRFEGVRESVVLLHDLAGDKKLVAYLTVQKGGTIDKSQLRQYAQSYLPEYMIPAAFAIVEQLPLLPNGKLDRSKLPSIQALFAEAKKGYTAPRTEEECTLVGIWQDVLRIEQIGIHDNFFELGGDSILSIQVVSRANRAGLHVSTKLMFEHQTIAALCQAMPAFRKGGAEQGMVQGEVPLTPIQHWFFEHDLSYHHANQALMLQVEPAVTPDILQTAVYHLVAHHDALRLRFVQESTGWRQSQGELASSYRFEVVPCRSQCQEALRAERYRTAEKLQAGLHLSDGPLVRFAYFTALEEKPYLLIVIHHLLVDGVSWRILLEDLQTICEQLMRGEAISLPAKTTSYQAWANHLAAYAQTITMNGQHDFWREHERTTIPYDFEQDYSINTHSLAETVTISFTPEETKQVVEELPFATKTKVNDILLTALLQTMTRWMGTDSVYVDLEGHGRHELSDEMDLSRTVGWFTAIFPVCLQLPGNSAPGEALRSVKEQLRQLPNHGLDYGIRRYLGSADVPRVHHKLPKVEICFNYMGKFDLPRRTDNLFAFTDESTGPLHAPESKRPYVLEINGIIVHERLQMMFTYCSRLHRESTVRKLAESFRNNLQVLVSSAQNKELCGWTPSDFPLAGLTQKQLDDIHATAQQEIEDVYPLSSSQMMMISHHLFSTKSNNHTQSFRCVLEGELDVELFLQAWQRTTDKHPLLRSTFRWRGVKEPIQIVHRRTPVVIDQQDWRSYAAECQEESLVAFLAETENKGFDFTSLPLMRLTLIRLADEKWHFVWTYPTSLFDGWSWSLVLKEVFSVYTSLRTGQGAMDSMVIPYKPYIQWQRTLDQNTSEAFWKEELGGYRSRTVPFGIKGSGAVLNADYHQAERRAFLDEIQFAHLVLLCRQHGLTLPAVLQGIWAVILGEHDQSEDVLIGMLSSGRQISLDRIESMVGVFVQTLPVRIRLAKEQPLLDWFKEIHAKQADFSLHGFMSPQQVAKWSGVPKSVVQQAIYERTIVYVHQPEELAELPPEVGLSIRDTHNRVHFNVPLRVYGIPSERLELSIKYNELYVDRATVDWIAESFIMLLRSLPDNMVGTLGALTDAWQTQTPAMQEKT